MQVRFRTYDAKTDTYRVLTYFNCEDYHTMYELLMSMCDKKECCCLELNTEDVVDTEGHFYHIEGVHFVIPSIGGELLPHIAVTVEEDY